MNALRSRTKAKAGHRPAMPLRVGRNVGKHAAEQAQTKNERLIFDYHRTAGAARRRVSPAAPVNPPLESASRLQKSSFGGCHGAVMHRRLNAFFAISVNSLSMRLVNFSCCVGSAPKLRARGATRTVTPQPMRAAVRTEAGAHACL
jgi:hypothetical protein